MDLFPDAIVSDVDLVEEQKEEILIIEARQISKSFGKKKVLQGLDFTLPKGQIYAICGSNGAGKSVFLRILMGLVYPDSGSVKVNGKLIGNELEFPKSVGSLIDHPGFLLSESGYKNLELLALISGKADKEVIRSTMHFVGLDPDDRKPVRTYSVGMRQRLGLAQAIMEDPTLLILDEPTAGLDIEAQQEIYDYLITLRRQGKTILITSHSLNEVKLLCDKAFQVREGKLTLMEDIDSRTAYR